MEFIPLRSINSKIFINGLVDTFGGTELTLQLKEQAHVWNIFVQRLLLSGYIIPAGLKDLGQYKSSWIVKWPEGGISDSHFFNNLQYSGLARTINEIPSLDLDLHSDTEEKTVELANGDKYIIGVRDLEMIICMVKGLYFITHANCNSRTFDLEISEEYINETLCDAILDMNGLINSLNWHLATQKTKAIRYWANLRLPGKRFSGMNPFAEVTGSGRLTRHVASLNGEYLGTAYKVKGRKVSRGDIIRLLNGDIRKVHRVMQAIEQAMQELANRGIGPEVRSHIGNCSRTLNLSASKPLRQKIREML